MISSLKKILKSVAVVSLIATLFCCTNNPKEVRNFLKEKNLPIGVAKNIYNVYKDSGIIASKLVSSLLKDYSNRKRHPYSEFPEGIKIVSFKNKGKDSITITGDYALTYSKTQISEIRGNVVVVNHKDKSILETDQLFWDQNTDYFYSEKPFKSTTLTDTISGIGFESKKDLAKFLAKRITGYFTTIDN